MKKLLSIAICLIGLATISPPAEAQTPIAPSKAANTNADVSYLPFKMAPYFDHMAVQAIVTKTSGTPAGYVLNQYSLDGTNYVNGVDSLLVTNVATQSKIWNFSSSGYLYYRLMYVSTGTQVSALTGKYVVKTRPIK